MRLSTGNTAAAELSPTNTRNINSGRFKDLSADKLRGGYYTSAELAAWICNWAVRSSGDHILEPSCGDGVFLKAALDRLMCLGAENTDVANQLLGIEIVATEAHKGRDRLRGELGALATDIVEARDLFEWWNNPARRTFDAIVGNPPFIRYQSFPEPHRGRAMDIMKGLGLSPNRLTNIWVPFVVASAAALRPGGCMGFVLPAELLQVSYASQLRSFLTDRFTRIDLIACNELFFKKAEQEIIILLADGARSHPSTDNCCLVTMTERETAADIVQAPPSAVLQDAVPKTVRHDSEKWLKYFLSPTEISFMRDLRSSNVAAPFGTFASVRVGVVTGRNQFFVMSKSDTEKRGLAQHTVPLISKSAQLSGSCLSKRDWEELSAKNQLVHLLDLNSINGSPLPKKLEEFIRLGEAENIHLGYKCSIREPWYAVPSIWTPDAFLFRQIYDFPRAVLNSTKATCTDTIHRIKCKAGPESVIANTYTHLTAASAEIEGRSYGGGVLELEPSEAERMLVPAKLGPALPLSECNHLIRNGRLADVLLENDRRILIGTIGLSRRDCEMLRNIWTKMRNRRMCRRRNGK